MVNLNAMQTPRSTNTSYQYNINFQNLGFYNSELGNVEVNEPMQY